MQTSHRHAAQTMAQRMAWDYLNMGCLEGVDVLRVQTSCEADWGEDLDQHQRMPLQVA